MELGLTLGDHPTPSKPSDGENKSCMALKMNPLDLAQHDHDHDDDGYEDDDDDDEHDKEDKGKERLIKDVAFGSQRISSMNPPVQLDLLPSEPVLRLHTSFPWSSDNGSSEGGSSGNAAAGRGFEVRRMTMGTEEATSSFRLEFMSNGGRMGSENSKRNGFEMGNDAVMAERGSSRASDEDEHGMSRKKLRLSKEQSAYLEESFKEHNTLNPKQKLALAQQLHLRPRQVEVWFQNRRARTKLKQTEVDFEYLKRCCETLTDENRRLHKELQELRALKTSSNPFYMQPPATTLTMCPSCERIATTVPTPASTTTTILTKPVEQYSKKGNTPLTQSPKQGSLMFAVAHAREPPSSNSHHQPPAPS